MKKIWYMALVAALGGFLFGFDTIVINGAEQDIQRIWGLSGAMHGWVVSSALWGTVAGALSGGWISDRFGRKTLWRQGKTNKEKDRGYDNSIQWKVSCR